jgi:hypothetical protein
MTTVSAPRVLPDTLRGLRVLEERDLVASTALPVKETILGTVAKSARPLRSIPVVPVVATSA